MKSKSNIHLVPDTPPVRFDVDTAKALCQDAYRGAKETQRKMANTSGRLLSFLHDPRPVDLVRIRMELDLAQRQRDSAQSVVDALGVIVQTWEATDR